MTTPNFIYDNVALPANKVDASGSSAPITSNPERYWSPDDGNRVFQALKDTRTAVLANPVSAKQFGAVGDGVTNDTAAIQAAMDYAAALGGGFAGGARGVAVYLPASPTPYMITNLRIPGYVRLVGDHMGGGTTLKRIPASTGAAIQEKADTVGASGVWLQNLKIDGNGTAGDGVSLGQIGGATPVLNFLASIENVSVFSFPSGSGFKLNANAVSCRYLWANACQIGVNIAGGGGNSWHAVWAENNTTNDVLIGSSGDNFYQIQTEPGPDVETTPSILINGASTHIFGVYIGQLANRNELIKIATGANRCSIRGARVVTNGFTFTNLILNEAYALGTGSSVTDIDEYVMGEASGTASFYINQSTGHVNSVIADAALLGGTLQVTGNIGFYNHAPAAKPTISGSRGGNAALASLLTGLAGLGLITDSTTA